MRDLIVSMIVFGSLPVILARPYVGILVWSWLGYMNPHRLTWGFAYDFPFAQVVAITLLIGLLVTSERKRFPITPTTVIWLLLIAWMGVSTLLAIYPEAAQTQMVKVLKIQLVVFLTMMVVTTRKRIDGLVWIIVLSLGFFGVKGGIFTIAHGGVFRVWGPPGSYVEENNALALATLMIIPLMVYLRAQMQAGWARAAMLAAIVLCAFSVLGSQSRGALVGGAAMACFLWMKSAHKVVSGIGVVAVVVVILAFAPQKWHDRMDTIQNYEQDASAMGRINAWGYSINVANDRIAGAGFSSWSPETFARWAKVPDVVVAAHSIYFGILADHGWLGLAMFLAVLFFAWRNSVFIVNATKGTDQQWLGDLSRMIQVSMAAYCTGGAFLSLSYFDLPWHLMALLVIGADLAKSGSEMKSISGGKSNRPMSGTSPPSYV